MISIVSLWDRLNVLAKTGTSGYCSQDEFNSDIDSVQLEIAEILSDVYETNKKASDALSLLITTANYVSSSTGNITKDPTYLHLCTVMLSQNGKLYPAKKIATNEVAMVQSSPIRNPQLSNNELCYYYADGTLNLLPKQTVPVSVIYCKKPVTASIILTPTSVQDEDYLIATTNNDLISWPSSVFNLFVYMMLEKRGIQLKEEMIFEFSQFGISREMIKTKVNA